MLKKGVLLASFALLILVLLLASCRAKPTPTAAPSAPTDTPLPATAQATPEPTPFTESKGRILISELLPGVPGDNNQEFIEFYNAGTRPVDLNGWSLWYQVSSGQEEKLVYAWDEAADMPGLGHYLLTRAGRDVIAGIIGDAEYEVSLFEGKGGLLLRDAQGKTVDALGWGDAPPEFFAGSPVVALQGGASLERSPGGTAGTERNSGDNSADFVANPSPNPQNSGSQLTPRPDRELTLTLNLAKVVEPGEEMEITLNVQNLSGGPAHDVRVSLPRPGNFEVLSLPAGARQTGGRIEWIVPMLAGGDSATATVILSSPWTYLNTRIQGAYAEAAGWPLRAYVSPTPISIVGGSIPIATARILEGKTVTIEGSATMYTGAFYAGSGTKFYLQDETGGIQVYCPGGAGIVKVGLGDRVRVTGEIEIYRGSIEIVPNVYPDDVEILQYDAAELDPIPVTIQAAGSDESVLGQLIVVEGTVVRIEEFSYSYEVSLADKGDYTQLLHIEKETGINVEPLELGKSYRVTGISEIYVSDWQLKPRQQSDFVEVFPPELMLEITARNSVPAGGVITYTLTVHNHTQKTLTNVHIATLPPAARATVLEVLDGGYRSGEGEVGIIWIIEELPAGGGRAAVHYTVQVAKEASEPIIAPPATARADQWPGPVQTGSLLIFVGSRVPIWAIQGDGPESPYVRGEITTVGVVTGVFPELEGFWIQEPETDADPATSAGLFVLAEAEVELEAGDLVQVTGKVRERSGQTTLHLLTAQDLTVISSGNQLPPAAELDPPQNEQEAMLYYERLEGTLVQVSQPAVAVAPTTKYGETALVGSKWGVERVMHGQPTGLFIFVDDGSSSTHTNLSSLPFAIQSGDRVAGVLGPLAYTYGNYKIEPITTPVITPTERPLPMLEPVGTEGFSVATFNVENLFDFQDPNPSDPPKPSLREYKHKLGKTAEAILAAGAPTIVGLQEVENIGVLEDLAEQQAIAQFNYRPFLVEGTDSRGIDVGYLVRADQASVQGAAAYPAPEELTSRPPLLITVTLSTPAGEAPTIYLLNNHFTSMSGGEAATEPRRTAQAEWNVTLVNRILAQEPDAYVVVMGDLNSYYDARPLEALREAGLRHVYEFVEPERPYTYIYQGESETLDHILLTPSLYRRLARVEALHINADYAPAAPGDGSPRRSSDHDPLVAVFSLTGE